MITFGPFSPADVAPDAVVNAADPSVADSKTGDASGFGDLLRQLMGAAAADATAEMPADALSKGTHGAALEGETALGDDDDDDHDPDADPGATGVVIDFVPQPTVVRALPSPLWATGDPGGPAGRAAARDIDAAADSPTPVLPLELAGTTPLDAARATAPAAATPDEKALPRDPITQVSMPAESTVQTPGPAPMLQAPEITANEGVDPTAAPPVVSPTTIDPNTIPVERRGRDGDDVRSERGKKDRPAIGPVQMPSGGLSPVRVDSAYDNSGTESKGRERRSFAESALQGQEFRAERPSPGPTFAMVTEGRLTGFSSPSVTIETVAPAPMEATLDADLPPQIVQSIRLQAVDGGGEAHVRLRPEYLGDLAVAVKVMDGAVTATLQSETPAVRQWVESNEATLRQALAEHGLHLDRLIVSDEAPTAESDNREERRQQSRQQQGQPQPESRRPRKDAAEATFEVLV